MPDSHTFLIKATLFFATLTSPSGAIFAGVIFAACLTAMVLSAVEI